MPVGASQGTHPPPRAEAAPTGRRTTAAAAAAVVSIRVPRWWFVRVALWNMVVNPFLNPDLVECRSLLDCVSGCAFSESERAVSAGLVKAHRAPLRYRGSSVPVSDGYRVPVFDDEDN